MLNIEFDSDEAFQLFGDFVYEQARRIMDVAGDVFLELDSLAQKINSYFE